MTQVHFTLKREDIQSLINESVSDDLSKYQRNEKALLASMLEMYVSGVSTRKVTNIIEELCGKSVSKSFVSSLTKELDKMVEVWRNSSLEGTCYPYLMVDVLFH